MIKPLEERRKEKIEILKKVKNLSNIDIERSMQNFVRNKDKFEVYCKNGHSFLSDFGHLKRGRSCQKCFEEKNLRERKEKFLSKLKERDDFDENDFSVSVDEFKGQTSIVHAKCLIHDFTYSAMARELINGRKCPFCSPSTISNLTDEIRNAYWRKRIKEKELEDENYKAEVSDDVDLFSKTQIIVKCKKHNKTWKCSLQNFCSYPGYGCPDCMYEKIRIKNRRTFESYIKEANEIHGGKYDYSLSKESDFKNRKSYLTIICNDHEKPYIFRQSIGKHIYSFHGCPKCNESHAERLMSIALDRLGIEYEREKGFDGMIGVGGGNLRVDFYIRSMNMAVEVDGEQHFHEFRFNGDAKPLSYVKTNDRLKEKFLDEKGIKLVRIPFYKFKFITDEEKLKEMLSIK